MTTPNGVPITVCAECQRWLREHPGKRYCVIHSAGALADPRVATVHDWLVAEACAAELAAAPSADAASTPGE